MASAGFITVSESISFILGANIGSVSTAWIVAVKVTKAALPLFVVGVIGSFFSKRRGWKYFFRFLIGLGLIFHGLTLMSSSMAVFRSHPALLDFVSKYDAANSVPALFLLILVGILFTAVIQSSGATAAMTISAAANGLFSIHSAAAIVLGATLGTTITAFLASLGGSRDGRRVAFIQAGINVVGVIAGTFLFYPSVNLSLFLGRYSGGGVAFSIAFYMTLLKLMLVVLIYPVKENVVKISYRFIRERFGMIRKRLTIPEKTGNVATLLIPQILSKNVDILLLYIRDMLAYSYILVKKPYEHGLFERILKYERFIDKGQRSIVRFIADAHDDEEGHLWLYLKMADEIESIADHAKAVAKNAVRMSEKGVRLQERDLYVIREAYRRIFLSFHESCVSRSYDRRELETHRETEYFIRSEKRKLLMVLASGRTEETEGILHSVDILAEYNKINHNLKRILQVNLGGG